MEITISTGKTVRIDWHHQRKKNKVRGGMTTCHLTIREIIHKAPSRCSKLDNFCYAVGRFYSTRRALKLSSMELNPDEQSMVWDYFLVTMGKHAETACLALVPAAFWSYPLTNEV